MEFPGGGRVQSKKRSVGGVWTFSGTTQCDVRSSRTKISENSPFQSLNKTAVSYPGPRGFP